MASGLEEAPASGERGTPYAGLAWDDVSWRTGVRLAQRRATGGGVVGTTLRGREEAACCGRCGRADAVSERLLEVEDDS